MRDAAVRPFLPAALIAGVLALGDGRGLEFTAAPGPVPGGGIAIGALDATALWWAVLGALAGGLLLNLMPCVFPILALKAAHLARAGGDEREAHGDAAGCPPGRLDYAVGREGAFHRADSSQERAQHAGEPDSQRGSKEQRHGYRAAVAGEEQHA